MSERISPSSISDVTPVERERLQFFIDSIVDYAILSLDPRGYVSSWNQGAERLKGYTRDEIIGRHFSKFYAPKDQESGLPFELLKRAEDEGHVEHTGWRVRKDGTRFWGDVVITAVRSAEGELLGFTKITRDLTEKKLAEDREHEVTQVLERNNRLKSEFVANMSHEVRTPLNGIIGMLTLLLDTDLSPRQRDYAETAASSSQALLRIVNDILDFSKVEAGKLELEHVPFMVPSVVEEVRSLFTPQTRAKGLQLEAHTDEAVPPVAGDPGRLRQVLANLMGNAVKFTTEGFVSCSVSLVEAMGEDVRLRFEVTDSGVGLNEHEISRLFEAFAQADLSTTRRFGGTGLGLAICRQLLQLMGTDLQVTSIPGRGSTFWFEVDLPVAEEPKDEPVKKKSANGPTLRGRILVAEDHPVNQKVVKNFLDNLGCESVIVENGQEALDALENQHFDVILMDCHMPVMDGFVATQKIRTMAEPLASIPIIAVTASALPQERDRCLNVGMNDFVAKPMSPKDLENALTPYLSRRDEIKGIDLTYLDGLRQAMGDRFGELVDTFLQVTVDHLAKLKDALTTRDLEQSRMHAHTIKGGSAALGLQELSAIALELENASREGNLKRSEEIFVRLRESFDELRAQLAAT